MTRGHWICYVKTGNTNQQVWWKLDDCRPISANNPFASQCCVRNPVSPGDDFSIDILVLKR